MRAFFCRLGMRWFACFETRGDGAWARDKTRDVADGRASFFEKLSRIVEMCGSVAGRADDKIGAERELAESLGKGVGEGCVVACCVATVHRLEHVFAAALDGNVDELVNAVIREAIQKRFLIAEDMARIAHAEADAVIAVHVREDSLREFGEIRADVKTVTGAILAGELDF